MFFLFHNRISIGSIIFMSIVVVICLIITPSIVAFLIFPWIKQWVISNP